MENILNRARYKGRTAREILDDPNTTDEQVEELKKAIYNRKYSAATRLGLSNTNG